MVLPGMSVRGCTCGVEPSSAPVAPRIPHPHTTPAAACSCSIILCFYVWNSLKMRYFLPDSSRTHKQVSRIQHGT
jgi:hypothetical protein